MYSDSESGRAWRGFVAMEHTFNQFGDRYLDRIDRMYPQLRPLTDTFREVKGIKRSPPRLTMSKTIEVEEVNPIKIETALVLKQKMEDTPALPLPDPDCVPLYADGNRLFICKRSSDGVTTLIDSVDANTPEWRGVATRIKATFEYRSALMALNDKEFEEYLKYSGRQRKRQLPSRKQNDNIVQSHHHRTKANA